jgi:Flp pilus assembly pilin Flp
LACRLQFVAFNKTPGVAMKKLHNILKIESGATSVEYAILLALIAAVIIASAFSAGGVSSATWNANAEAIANTIK